MKATLNTAEISDYIQKQIGESQDIYSAEVGQIIRIADGVVHIYGLQNVEYGETLIFDDGILGLALNLERDVVGAVVFGDTNTLSVGQAVKRGKSILSVPVGRGLLGRVVNALGQPIDDKGELDVVEELPIETIAPGVIWRKKVNRSLQTGIKAIDSMIPIGRGQRELIIGDRQTGKTTLALDTMINQVNQNVVCIYVAIGQKTATIVNIINKLKEHNALENTIVVVASAAETAALQFIAPYAGCAMGEYFRDRGEDALIVYDDLTKHAWAYRQISLLLRRPPGREAYPGDIFYLHSRLLERAAQVNEEYVAQKTEGKIHNYGSLTALPIIETQSGDVSSFIPTNVISITDGQIFLEADLFNAGIRPAINSGLSVSRVGGAAQTPLIKTLSSGVRLSLAQYRELAAFAQFASDLDTITRKQLEQGLRVMESMKQKPYAPLKVSEMALSLFAISHDIFASISITSIQKQLEKLVLYALHNYAADMREINKTAQSDVHTMNKLESIVKDFLLIDK